MLASMIFLSPRVRMHERVCVKVKYIYVHSMI